MFIIVYNDDECSLCENEIEIMSELEEVGFKLEDVNIYEVDKPIEFEVKLIRKQTLIRKEK